MDALAFFGLRSAEGPGQWELPVVPAVCSSLGALFGGCGLAAAVEALERTTGRPLVWATGQYLSFARPPAVLDIEVVEVVAGHQVSQARALCRAGRKQILAVNAALGRRPQLGLTGSWAAAPDVPAPADCRPRPRLERHRGTVFERVEFRVAAARDVDAHPGPSGDGRSALWVRVPDLEPGAAALAVIGDLVPFGIGQALGEPASGNSLDNTLRVAHRPPAGEGESGKKGEGESGDNGGGSGGTGGTGWILADVRIQAVADGFGHGLVHLWSEDGTLLGTASQSVIVRAPRGRR